MNRKFVFSFLIFFYSIFIGIFAHAYVDSESYEYPDINPFKATATSPLASLLAETDVYYDKKYCVKTYTDSDRENLMHRFNFEAKTKACFLALVNSKNKQAPLAFVLSGFGGGPHSSITTLLATKLHKVFGFHVILVPSPFYWQFTIMGLENSAPGAIKHDSSEVYKFMQQAFQLLKAKRKINPNNFYLTGYSMGALQSLFISYEDSKSKFFNFKKVVALNPPADLKNSSDLFDKYYASTKNKSENLGSIYSVAIELGTEQWDAISKTRKNEIDLDIFNAYVNRVSNSDATLLVAHSFYDTLFNATIIADESNNLDLFKDDELANSQTWYVNYHRRLKILSETWTFDKYLRQILWPLYKDRYESMEDLLYANSMHALEDYIRDNDHLILHHTKDDIIVTEDEIKFMQDIFGERALIFPRGGHLGNIWYPDNIEVFLQEFELENKRLENSARTRFKSPPGIGLGDGSLDLIRFYEFLKEQFKD